MLMKVLVTGLTGTLAPHFGDVFALQGCDVIDWDNQQIDSNDSTRVLDFLTSSKPDAIVHLAMGSEHWAGLLARWSAQHNCQFLFTSSAMVFGSRQDGPYQSDAPRLAEDDYGAYKIRCEDMVTAANPDAIILRMGWQFFPEKLAGNNMLAQLNNQFKQQGKVVCSTLWKPPVSHMQDTAEIAWRLLGQRAQGIWQLDSNSQLGLSLYQIASEMNSRLHLGWIVEPDESYHHDQRLVDDRLLMPDLFARLTPLSNIR